MINYYNNLLAIIIKFISAVYCTSNKPNPLLIFSSVVLVYLSTLPLIHRIVIWQWLFQWLAHVLSHSVQYSNSLLLMYKNESVSVVRTDSICRVSVQTASVGSVYRQHLSGQCTDSISRISVQTASVGSVYRQHLSRQFTDSICQVSVQTPSVRSV